MGLFALSMICLFVAFCFLIWLFRLLRYDLSSDERKKKIRYSVVMLLVMLLLGAVFITQFYSQF